MRFPLVACLLVTACSGLKPQLIRASVEKPSNVAVYFTVDTVKGEPVPGLTAEQFHIYEDEKLVSPYESKQTILNPEVAAEHDTLLLVDLSGSVTQSGQVNALQDAVNAFIERVGKLQHVALYAFDGRPDVVQLRGFGAAAAPVSLSGFVSTDLSTNLNGAVVKSVEALQHQLEKSQSPLRFGTLVIFTDGTDHAHRVERSVALKAIRDVSFEVFVIGVGAEIDEQELKAFSKSGAALSKDASTVGEQFGKIAERIEGMSRRFYLLSYCSPSRAGKHTLAIEPFLADGQSGRMSYDFDATGFEPRCDPNRKPSFDVRRPALPKPF